MKIAIAKVKSVSPYSQSQYVDQTEIPKKPKELADDYEKRTWRYRLHVTSDGFVEM